MGLFFEGNTHTLVIKVIPTDAESLGGIPQIKDQDD